MSLPDPRADSLTGPELEALRRRIGSGGDALDDAATLRDVAEASGLTEGDVAAHLRQIRAEAAFSHPTVPRPSALPWIGAGALVVGLGVTWWRLHPPELGGAPRLVPVSVPARMSGVRSVETTPLATQWNTDGAPKAPPGLKVETIGQTTDHLSDGWTSDVRALPYETVRDGLVASAEALVDATARAEAGAVAPPGARYHGMDGGLFAPRPGFVRTAMFGWAGSDSAWVGVPLTDAGRREIRALATRVLSDAKAEQDTALAPIVHPTQGLVAPPPGFSVRFAGRRLDFREGPRVSFAPIDRTQVARRMEAALLNAVARDRRPPVGPWSGNAAQDARIPQPSLSRVEVMGPDGVVSADLPTALDDPGATARAVRAFAGRVAAGIDTINQKALNPDETARP